MPLRTVIGELGLPALCRGSTPLVLQVLRTMLWHLDRIPTTCRACRATTPLPWSATPSAPSGAIERAGWEELLALLQGLGDLPNMRRTSCAAT